MLDHMTPGVVYMGFLSNCDDSILRYQLGNDFITNSLEHDKGLELLKLINRSHEDIEVYKKYLGKGIMNDPSKPFYVIVKKINPEIVVSSPISMEEIQKFHRYSFELQNEGATFVRDKLRLMRLFTEGNIVSPLQITYIDLNPPIQLASSFSLNVVEHEKYHLDESKIDILSKFIEGNALPFKDKSLNLAFESFELSYDVSNTGFALVSCITAMECLLGDKGSGISCKIARNMAILLGDDGKPSKDIFDRVKKLYKKRSRFIHERDNRITIDDVKVGRNLVRSAIINCLRAGIPKT